jgi:hypothetical protein
VTERTHTPPPPSSTGRVPSSKGTQSSEKSMQNSASFNSKKQTAYVNPKVPDDNML